VTTARLREAAGGGGHIRLKAVVEAWRERRREAAKPTEDSVPENAGRGRGKAGKSQGRDRSLDQDVRVSAKGSSSRRRNKDAAGSITLEDAEQAGIAMEAGRVKAALSGGEATKTETPGEPDVPSSIEQAEADITEALDTIARQETEDAPETEAISLTKSDTQPLEGTAAASVSAAPTSLDPVPPAAGAADADIARLEAQLKIFDARTACYGTRSGMSGRPGSGKSNSSTA